MSTDRYLPTSRSIKLRQSNASTSEGGKEVLVVLDAIQQHRKEQEQAIQALKKELKDTQQKLQNVLDGLAYALTNDTLSNKVRVECLCSIGLHGAGPEAIVGGYSEEQYSDLLSAMSEEVDSEYDAMILALANRKNISR